MGQGLLRAPFQKIKAENLQDSRICKIESTFGKFSRPFRNSGSPLEEAGSRLHFREKIFELGSGRRRKKRQGPGSPREFWEVGRAVNAVRLLLEAVIAQFIPDIEQDEEATGHPQGKAKDAYKREQLIASQVSPRNQQVVFAHNGSIYETIGTLQPSASYTNWTPSS